MYRSNGRLVSALTTVHILVLILRVPLAAVAPMIMIFQLASKIGF
jgi:hypothetical protein